MAKKQSKAREKQRQQQNARKAAKRKRLQQSGRTTVYTTPKARLINETGEFGFGPEEYGMMLINSENLADELEFEDIFIDPSECMGALVNAAESTGVSPDQYGRLQREEQEDFFIDAMDEAIRHVLRDKDLRQQILKQVDALQQRYKNQREGISLAYLQASAIYTFLESDKTGKAWAGVGLVRELVMKGIRLGIELVNIVDGEPEQLLSDTEARQKIVSLYEEFPNLRQFLDKEIGDIWQKSLDAIFDGEWEIDLFTPDEIEGSFEIFERYFPVGEKPEDRAEDFQNRAAQFVPEIERYVRGLLSPERLEQMGSYLDNLSTGIPNKQRVFITTLAEDIKAADELDDLVPALAKIFLGEVRAVMRQAEADSEESE